MAETKPKLNTETDTPEMERRVMAASTRVIQWAGGHHHVSADFEHGQWWITCKDCGGQWSVADASYSGHPDAFDFEEVTAGDESCKPRRSANASNRNSRR